jgi:hypothetical protein
MQYSQCLLVCLLLIFSISISGCIGPGNPKDNEVKYHTITNSEQVFNINNSTSIHGAGLISYANVNKTYSFNVTAPNITQLFINLTAHIYSNTSPDNISITVFPPTDSNATFLPANPVFSNNNSTLQLSVSICSNPLTITKRGDETLNQFLNSNTCRKGLGEWTVQINIFQQGGCIPWIMEIEWNLTVDASYYSIQIE